MSNLPKTQSAIQLTGVDTLELNDRKDVLSAAGSQILARVDAVGICFSDLKLLKQFDKHPRKAQIQQGVEQAILNSVPTYCPDGKPTVPGHEIMCTIVEVGDAVTKHKAGERVLVQTDYRWLKTAASNAAIGYNFEGGMQEYILVDERVIVDPETQESFLLPVTSEEHSASSIALVEPWACVESSYITEQRQAPKAGGKLLVIAQESAEIKGVAASLGDSTPGVVKLVGGKDHANQLQGEGIAFEAETTLGGLPDAAFDDIIYFGADKTTIEALDGKLAKGGIVNIVLGGKTVGSTVEIDVGRVHYQDTRWIGTTGGNAADSYATIPADGEIRPNNNALVMGAGGPMGQMHVIRLVSSEIDIPNVTGTDLDLPRLKALEKKVAPMAAEKGRRYRLGAPDDARQDEPYDYIAIMVPVGPLVAGAVAMCSDNAVVNIFAGIPVGTKQAMDLDAIIAKRIYMFGTSGSRLMDMKICLEKVLTDKLDTNSSVDAITGLAGAIAGIRAVENREMAGKIIVYPRLKDLPLITLTELAEKFPSVAAKLNNGMWSKAAEDELHNVVLAGVS